MVDLVPDLFGAEEVPRVTVRVVPRSRVVVVPDLPDVAEELPERVTVRAPRFRSYPRSLSSFDKLPLPAVDPRGA